jgi:ribosomal protein L37AE/L43A
MTWFNYFCPTCKRNIQTEKLCGIETCNHCFTKSYLNMKLDVIKEGFNNYLGNIIIGAKYK